MAKSGEPTPFDQKLFLVFIVTFAVMTFFEFAAQFLYPYTPDWRSNIITSLFTSGLAVIIAYFPLSSYFDQNTRLLREADRRRSLEEELEERERRLRTILNAAQVGIILIDAETHRIIQANPMALALFRESEQEVTGAVCHTFICPAEEGKCPVTDLGQTVNSSERILIAKDGTRVPVLTTVVATELGERKVLVESFIDTSEQKRSEQAKLESEEKYRILAEDMKDVVWQMDGDMTFTYISPSISRQGGYSPEEVVGRRLFDFISSGSAEYIRSRIAELGAQVPGVSRPESATYQLDLVCRDGTIRPIEVVTNPVFDARGTFTGWHGVSRDISERKQVEEALRVANRKLNLLSSVTRHDINNQIMGLRAYLELSKKNPTPAQLAGYIEKEDQAVAAIEDQIAFTQFYQDIGVNLPKWQDLSSVIQSVVHQFDPKGPEVNIRVADTEIFADPLLEKVFYNLMDNSVRHGDRVTRIEFFAGETDAGLIITYRDNGVGIPHEDKQKLFQKGFGKNTGLGLFLSREILSITGISITENGKPGEGVQFEIAVPVGRFRTRT